VQFQALLAEVLSLADFTGGSDLILSGAAPIRWASTLLMIWHYKRGLAQTCVEVRREHASNRYFIIVTGPDGGERLHAYASPRRLIAAVGSLQRDLIANGWRPAQPTGAVYRKPLPPRWRAVDRMRQALMRIAATFGF
jgi:hypothetical protein